MRSTHASLLSHYSKKKLVGDQERRRRDGEVPKGGHVTPSFQTNDKIEFKSNINLQVSLF